MKCYFLHSFFAVFYAIVRIRSLFSIPFPTGFSRINIFSKCSPSLLSNNIIIIKRGTFVSLSMGRPNLDYRQLHSMLIQYVSNTICNCSWNVPPSPSNVGLKNTPVYTSGLHQPYQTLIHNKMTDMASVLPSD